MWRIIKWLIFFSIIGSMGSQIAELKDRVANLEVQASILSTNVQSLRQGQEGVLTYLHSQHNP